ncbi:MAG: hypothetical protein WC678_04320 [Parcubacteria group bacterium]|jgi:hypothetical protein
MIDIALNFLAENYPKIFGALFIIVGIVWLTIKCHSFYIDTKKVCNSHDDLKSKLDLLLDKFNSLIAVLGESNAIKNPEIFSTNSPLNLTEKGINFIKRLSWDKILEDEKERKILFDTLDKLHLKNKLDVERYCTVILTEFYGSRKENPFTKVKEFLYNDATIDRQDAISACAIYLRDKYLESHPEII